MNAFGKIPPYQDISHFRAPYKNAIFAGFGAMQQTQFPTRNPAQPITVLYYTGAHSQVWFWTSIHQQWDQLIRLPHENPFNTLKALADSLAHSYRQDVAVYRSSGPQGPIGGRTYYAHGQGLLAQATHGFGEDPGACLPPKWVYNDLTDACACAPGYAPSPDGTDCLPFVSPNPVPPTGGLNTWSFTDPVTGATTPVPAGTPGAVPTPAATTPTACTGYQVGSTCVPTWALWVGGGLAALVVVDMVL